MSCRLTIISIIISAFVLIPIYFTIYSLGKSDHDTKLLSRSIVTVYMCPQFASTSEGYFHVDFIDNRSVDYSKICKSDDILLVYILSQVANIDRRQKIRRTWANKNEYEQLFRTCFIFLIGLENDPLLNSKIISEASIYGDIVQLNLIETYQNVVYKEVGGLKWSHMYASHIPYLFKTDDNIIIDTLLLGDITRFFITNRTEHSDYFQKQKKIKEFASQMSSVNRYTLFKGLHIDGGKTIRRGKFGLSHVAWNHDKLPGYCRGSGYMLSSFIRDRLYRASLCYAVEYVPWEGDLFVSGALATAAAVYCSPWSMEYSQSLNDCSSRFENQTNLLLCSTSTRMGQSLLEDYTHAWKVILNRHSITNETIAKGKKKRIRLLRKQSEQKLLINESIIEQMQDAINSQALQIVPLEQLEEKLD